MKGCVDGRRALGVAIFGALAWRSLRRWYNQWGATEAEVALAMPGDELVPAPKLGYTRAITIDAPPSQVWPWLAQIGQGRGGLYSYDSLENLAGCDIHSASTILVEHQDLEIGDLIHSGPDRYPCWAVMQIVPDRILVLLGAGTPAAVEIPYAMDEVPPRGYAASTWQWVLQPVADGTKTRLLVRQRLAYSPTQTVLWHLTEPINFIMERKMMLGIKQRAEAQAQHRTVDCGDSGDAMFPATTAQSGPATGARTLLSEVEPDQDTRFWALLSELRRLGLHVTRLGRSMTPWRSCWPLSREGACALLSVRLWRSM